MKEHAAVAGRIREVLADVDQAVDRTEHLLDKAQRTGDADYLDGVALNLHGFYVGVEGIFEDIARSLDEGVPSGPNWHRDLLLQMSAGIDDGRPAVIMRETRLCLDEYRGFRHVVRNVYTFNLRPTRLAELTDELRSCYQAVVRDLEAFADFLEDLDHSSHDETE